MGLFVCYVCLRVTSGLEGGRGRNVSDILRVTGVVENRRLRKDDVGRTPVRRTGCRIRRRGRPLRMRVRAASSRIFGFGNSDRVSLASLLRCVGKGGCGYGRILCISASMGRIFKLLGTGTGVPVSSLISFVLRS